MRNFYRNLKLIKKPLLYKTSGLPVIITGSGPGLEKVMPLIYEMQNNCIITASSSSLSALSHNGISADIVIATDGGSWALPHLYSLFRNKNAEFLAANLCAALPSQCADMPFLLLNDGSLWQSVIFHALSLPTIIIPQRGTVTASAVDLALTLTSADIYLAGIDLGVNDIRTHVRPYGFDYLLSDSADRFSPVYSKCFFRSGQMRSGGSMDIYASWFKNQISVWPKRIFSLGASHDFFLKACPSKKTIKETEILFKTITSDDDPALFPARASNALVRAIKDARYSQKIKDELAPLLFPEKKEITLYELEDAVMEAANE